MKVLVEKKERERGHFSEVEMFKKVKEMKIKKENEEAGSNRITTNTKQYSLFLLHRTVFFLKC